MLSNDMPKAALHLSQVIKTLEAYANVIPSAASNPAPAADAKSDEAPVEGGTNAATEKIS